MTPNRYRFLLVLALLLEAGYLGMLALGNLGEQVVEFIALFLLLSSLYLACCFLITQACNKASSGNAEQTTRVSSRKLLLLIWGAGIAFRLTLLPLDPTLSEDLNRYRWQGKLQAAGGNPYTQTPDNPRWDHLRDRTWPHVNRKDLPSVYGPLLELGYFAYYRVIQTFEPDEIRQVWLFKLPYAIFELAVGAALMQLLAAAGKPRSWVLIYLWSPLMVVEFWAQGHNDSVAVVFVVLALAAALRQRWYWAFPFLTLATLAKFWPLVLFPFFLLQRREKRWVFRWKPALSAIPIALLVSYPYWGTVSNVTELLEGFVGGWRNNDSIYWLIYRFVGEDFERGTRVVRILLLAAFAGLWTLQLPLAKAAKWAVVLLLFFSANCFPWYLSWLVPLLALYPGSPLLLWTALVVLSYNVLIGYGTLGIWEDWPLMRLLEYAPVYALLGGVSVAHYAKRFGTPQHQLAKPGSESSS